MSVTDWMSAILHAGSQFLLVPVMVCLVALALAMVFCIGWVVVEYLTERKFFRVNQGQLIVDLREADYEKTGEVIRTAPLMQRQVEALANVASNMGLPDDELFALSQVELERCEEPYKHRLNLTDTIAKLGPMFGLMGTLIPLGPGIVAMGQNDVSQLSSSILIAFDTTIAGLVVAVIALVVSRIRRTWYGQYGSVMRALMTCILEEAAQARDEGVELPFGTFAGFGGDKKQPAKKSAQRDFAAKDVAAKATAAKAAGQTQEGSVAR